MIGTNKGYCRKIAFAYVFNLIFGAGALALPKAFARVGWVLGVIAFSMFAMISYCTATFMLEVMSIANALIRHTREKEKSTDEKIIKSDNLSLNNRRTSDDEHQPLLQTHSNPYELTTKLEMAELSGMFFHKFGVFIYYVVISMYLFGGMAAYAIIVSKSLAAVVCGGNVTFAGNTEHQCYNFRRYTINDMYRIMLSVFAATLCPFVFFNISKTKFLQLLTTSILCSAFITMSVLGLLKIGRGEGYRTPDMANFADLPVFFGVGVKSLMCQHCLPSIISPVRKKSGLKYMLLCDVISVTILNFLTCITAVFTFPESCIEDLYTLNFTNPECLKYILQLFPVFTLSTNFPTIGITLRENLAALFITPNIAGKTTGKVVRRVILPLLTVIPPIVIAYCTYDIEFLVSVTGAYPGAILQYVIPTGLVYIGRKKVKEVKELNEQYGSNMYRSPFSSNFFVFFIWMWYCVSLTTVTMRLFIYS